MAMKAANDAFEAAAARQDSETRGKIDAATQEIIARCDEWLASNGIFNEVEPVPGMDQVQLLDFTRRLQDPDDVPVDAATEEAVGRLGSAEADLLNNTQRNLLEHHLRFSKDLHPGDPGYLSKQTQNKAFQALVSTARESTDELLRKSYAVQTAGPPETHRVFATAEGEEMLQEWMKKRGAPNDAECAMLKRYLRADSVWEIYDWFNSRHLQKNAINLMMCDAFSSSKAFRQWGIIRYRAALVQTGWSLRYERICREIAEQETKKADELATNKRKATLGDTELRGDGDAQEAFKKRRTEPTLADIRGEMRPYIDEEMN